VARAHFWPPADLKNEPNWRYVAQCGNRERRMLSQQQQRQLKQRRKAELTEYHGAAQLVSAGRCGGELQGSFR